MTADNFMRYDTEKSTSYKHGILIVHTKALTGRYPRFQRRLLSIPHPSRHLRR